MCVPRSGRGPHSSELGWDLVQRGALIHPSFPQQEILSLPRLTKLVTKPVKATSVWVSSTWHLSIFWWAHTPLPTWQQRQFPFDVHRWISGCSSEQDLCFYLCATPTPLDNWIKKTQASNRRLRGYLTSSQGPNRLLQLILMNNFPGLKIQEGALVISQTQAIWQLWACKGLDEKATTPMAV